MQLQDPGTGKRIGKKLQWMQLEIYLLENSIPAQKQPIQSKRVNFLENKPFEPYSIPPLLFQDIIFK